MKRITYKHLETLADRLNVLTGSPTTPRDENGARIGHFHISCAYGGYELQRMVNTSGATKDYFSTGHTTARKLAEAMNAFIEGIELSKI